MPRQKKYNTKEELQKAISEWTTKYHKEHTIKFSLALSKEKDKDIIDYLESLPTSKNMFFKEAARQYIKIKNNTEKENNLRKEKKEDK